MRPLQAPWVPLLPPNRPPVDLCSHVRISFSSSMASAMTCMKVLHKVTACIYKQGDEKPAMKWSFLTKMQECDLSSFLRCLKSYGFDDRAKEIGISKYKMKLQYKRLTAKLEFPRGRIFAIDTDEQFKVIFPLLQDKHELIHSDPREIQALRGKQERSFHKPVWLMLWVPWTTVSCRLKQRQTFFSPATLSC